MGATANLLAVRFLASPCCLSRDSRPQGHHLGSTAGQASSGTRANTGHIAGRLFIWRRRGENVVWQPWRLTSTLLLALFCSAPAPVAVGQLTALRIEDYATMPISGATVFPSETVNSAYLARVNFLAEEPGNSNRFFVNDLNGPLYILDGNTRQFTEYLNFNGRGSAPGLFDRLYTDAGFATGLVTFQIDPGYADPASSGYGKFYTVHVEQGNTGSQLPSTTNYPNLDTSNYGVTTSIDAPGTVGYRNVLIEWKDTNIANKTFEGSARELLRMDARDRIHPMGDIIFNPTAGPDDADWRVMYISVGDAGNGENGDAAVRRTPQLLNALGGKILRIIPDLAGANTPSTLSANGKYRIPNDNPFTTDSRAAVFDEVYALGLRNPHRMSWDVDPANPENSHLIVSDIGLHTWEEVNIIHAGKNYGYSQREGNQVLISNNSVGPVPNPDLIAKDLVCTGGTGGFSNCSDSGTVTPNYPVIQYGHGLSGQNPFFAGDSISSGFVYRGSNIPELFGKYIFGDITTGAIYYADFEEMLAADDGDPSTLASFRSLNISWNDPNDPAGEQIFGTLTSDSAIRGPMFQIVEDAYEARGGQDPNLPGGANVTGTFGRADIRIAVDSDGELYILSKSDGMIRAIVGTLPAVAGDYDRSGTVDAADYILWRKTLGQTVGAFSGADGNGDGAIDEVDYDLWRSHFGKFFSDRGAAAVDSQQVPEASAGVLASLAAVLLLLTSPPGRGRELSSG
jgi:hypothetical protein